MFFRSYSVVERLNEMLSSVRKPLHFSTEYSSVEIQLHNEKVNFLYLSMVEEPVSDGPVKFIGQTLIISDRYFISDDPMTDYDNTFREVVAHRKPYLVKCMTPSYILIRLRGRVYNVNQTHMIYQV